MVAQLDRLYVGQRPGKVLPRLVSYALFEGRPLTTRGRWINPLVFAHLGLEMRLPQTREAKKPIFIVGTGRSGSTILGVVMSMHRDVGFLNEPKALWHAIYPCEDVVGNYAKGDARYRLEAGDATEKVKRRARRLSGAYLRSVNSTRVVDKYPELIFRVPFVRAIFPDAKFIFLVRNGWDTCRSIESWSGRLGTQVDHDVQDWWGLNNRKWRLMVDQLVPTEQSLADNRDEIADFADHTDMSVVEWIVTMREGLRQLRRNEDCFHMLRYEELVENPRRELSRVLAFCELKHDEPFFDFAVEKLQPPPRRSSFDMHPVLRQPFEKTMKALGY